MHSIQALFGIIFSIALRCSLASNIWWANPCHGSSCSAMTSLSLGNVVCEINSNARRSLSEQDMSLAKNYVAQLRRRLGGMDSELLSFLQRYQSNRQVPQLELLQSRICYNYQPSAHELTQKANPDKLVEALRNMTRSSYQHLAEASHHLHQILSYENTHEAPSLSEDIEDLRTSHDHTLCQLHRLHNHLSVNGPHSDTPCHAWRCFIQSMPRPTDHCLTPGDRTTSRLNHILLLQQSRDKLGNILDDFSAAEHELHSASKRSGDDI